MTSGVLEPGWQERRLSFGTAADDYDRYRPGYPNEAIVWCCGRSGGRVVDVGSGTGRFATAALSLGYDVLAVEPDPGMRAMAELALPGRTADGTAESIPVPDASADAVTAAQAYHWFDPEPAHRELARTLRMGGQFAALWNARDDRVPWVAELRKLIGGQDWFSVVTALDPPDFGPRFEGPEGDSWHHTQTVDVEGLVGLVASFSFVRLRPDVDEVLATVRTLATSHPDLVGRSTIDVPWTTQAFRAQVLRS